jgi:hypothetical protein
MQFPTTATHKDINPPQPGTQEYNIFPQPGTQEYTIFQSFTIFKPARTVLRHPLCKIALPGRSQLLIHSLVTQKTENPHEKWEADVGYIDIATSHSQIQLCGTIKN